MSASSPKIAPWEDLALRLIAIYKFIKAFLALILGLTLLHFVHYDVAAYLHDYIIVPRETENFQGDSENRLLNWLYEQAVNLTPHKMRLSAYASFFYATVFAVEGAGLYLKKHWAEYMVLIVTGSFLPFEGWLLYHHPVWWKFVLILGNLLIIAYLAHRIRLDYRNRLRSCASTTSPATATPLAAKTAPVASKAQ